MDYTAIPCYTIPTEGDLLEPKHVSLNEYLDGLNCTATAQQDN